MHFFLLLSSVHIYIYILLRQAHAVVIESLTLARIGYFATWEQRASTGIFTRDVKLLPLAKPQCNYIDPLKASHTYGEGHIHKHEFKHTQCRWRTNSTYLKKRIISQSHIHLFWLEAGDREHVLVITHNTVGRCLSHGALLHYKRHHFL